MAESQPFALVLRFTGVVVSRSALESALGVKVDRYESARTRPLHYAQIDMASGDDPWPATLDWVRNNGPKVRTLIAEHLIERASLDLAIAYPDDSMTTSTNLRSHVLEALGQHGIDIELSVYRESTDD